MPKGMMLAAGRGTRLGALTDFLPKPLLPVANRPVMVQGIRALQRMGITEIYANVCYRAQQILDAFGDGRLHNVRLHWSVETEPVGTAGGIKRLQHQLDNDLLVVVAGDAMLDIDLTPVLEAHQRSGAFASLATLAVDDPSQYGVVVTDADGRIIRFQEKPAPGTEISRQANTGIYVFQPEILDLIPAGQFTDFALHIFPEILQRKLPFYAIPVEGYWTDIGNPRDYLIANLDYLADRIKISGYGAEHEGNLIAPGALTTGSRLSNCVIGDRAVLPPGCDLRDSVIWPGTVLFEPLDLSHAVLTPWGSYVVEGKDIIPIMHVTASVA